MRKVKDSDMDATMEPPTNLKFSNFSIDALISPRNFSSLSPFLNLSPWLFPMSHGIGSHSAFSPYSSLASPHFPLSAHHPGPEVSYAHHNSSAAAAVAAAAAIGPASSGSSNGGGSSIPVPTVPEDLTLSRLGCSGSSAGLFSKAFSVQDYLSKTNQFLHSAASASLHPLHPSQHHSLEVKTESGASSGELSPSSRDTATTRIPKSSPSDNDTNSSPSGSTGESIPAKHITTISHHLHQHLSPLDSAGSLITASHPHSHPLFAHHLYNNHPASANGIQIGIHSPPGSNPCAPDSPPNTPGTSPSGKCHSFNEDSPLPLSGNVIFLF